MDRTIPARILDKAGVPYVLHDYTSTGAVAGADVASALGERPEEVFKTLVTVGASGRLYVFVVPVTSDLDMKKGAAAVGEKSVAMLPSEDLRPVTGYVHGGCSPLGIRRHAVTVVDASAASLGRMYVSAGRVGLQIEVEPKALFGVLDPVIADIAGPVAHRVRAPSP